MIRTFRMDLHIHTCLSPCGTPENVPTRIVEAAVETHLDAIGICDHNGSENVSAVRRAAARIHPGIRVFGGMEITTREEAHLLAIFEGEEELNQMQETVYAHLPGTNDPDAFGAQYIVDDEDYVIGYNDHLLMGATTMSIDDTVALIHGYGGLAFASHIDREAFGVISQLGFIPEDVRFDALEISPHYASSPFDLSPYIGEGRAGPVAVTFSDAHQLGDIGRAYTRFLMAGATLSELKLALDGLRGRHVVPIGE
jgi:PHP family Zn ribbon phosphoesterase